MSTDCIASRPHHGGGGGGGGGTSNADNGTDRARPSGRAYRSSLPPIDIPSSTLENEHERSDVDLGDDDEDEEDDERHAESQTPLTAVVALSSSFSAVASAVVGPSDPDQQVPFGGKVRHFIREASPRIVESCIQAVKVGVTPKGVAKDRMGIGSGAFRFDGLAVLADDCDVVDLERGGRGTPSTSVAKERSGGRSAMAALKDDEMTGHTSYSTENSLAAADSWSLETPKNYCHCSRHEGGVLVNDAASSLSHPTSLPDGHSRCRKRSSPSLSLSPSPSSPSPPSPQSPSSSSFTLGRGLDAAPISSRLSSWAWRNGELLEVLILLAIAATIVCTVLALGKSQCCSELTATYFGSGHDHDPTMMDDDWISDSNVILGGGGGVVDINNSSDAVAAVTAGFNQTSLLTHPTWMTNATTGQMEEEGEDEEGEDEDEKQDVYASYSSSNDDASSPTTTTTTPTMTTAAATTTAIIRMMTTMLPTTLNSSFDSITEEKLKQSVAAVTPSTKSKSDVPTKFPTIVPGIQSTTTAIQPYHRRY